jgi:non-heme chloroperoxidase
MQTRNGLLSAIDGDIATARIHTRDGRTLFHREWGSGRPILFVHSLSLTSAMWCYQEMFLGDRGFRCVSYDRRGHGRSDASAPDLDLNTFADDLAAVIDELDLRDVVLVGHSVGCGEIIRYIGRQGTSRIAKLVLLAPTTPYMLQTSDNAYGAPGGYLEQMRAAWASDYPRWLEDNKISAFTAHTSPEMMDWMRFEMARAHVPTVVAYHRMFVETDLRPDLAKIDRPVLILHGDRDVSAPVEITGQPTARGIRGAILRIYPGAAHALFLTHMDQVNRDILKFITS